MIAASPLVLRNVELHGQVQDVRMAGGVVSEIGSIRRRAEDEMDARGGALLPGLIDHHLHLFAAAIHYSSLDLQTAHKKTTCLAAIRQACDNLEPAAWLRCTGFDDSQMGLLSRDDLDQCSRTNPIRVQDRTGALWVLNSAALSRVDGETLPECAERDSSGRPTGRIWRGDAWLRTRIGTHAPSLAPLSGSLAAFGITGVTDAGATNGPTEAEALGQAREHGVLMQRLCLMSAGEIASSPHYEIGPIKILLDERDLPPLDHVISRIRTARALERRVAVHCVTEAELIMTLAAFEEAGAIPGDRIEHGGLIPEELIALIRTLGLCIVTQLNFIQDRGDRYARTLASPDLNNLYRTRSLLSRGIRLAAGSDTPYGSANPWLAIQTAKERKTKEGRSIGTTEQISARTALELYQGHFHDPAGAKRRVEVGATADLCLMTAPIKDVLQAPAEARVAATFVGGAPIYLVHEGS